MMSVNIGNALSNHDVESYLCATRAEGILKSKLDKKVGYLFLNKKGAMDIFAFFRLKKFIKENTIDLIHAHSSSYFTACMVKLIYPKIKIIWHDHYGKSEHVTLRKKFPINYFSKYFKAIISVNNLLKQWSEENLKSKEVYYLSNFATLNDDLKKTTLKGTDGKRIVCLAGFRPQKDHVTLLKAFNMLQENHDWTLHLVGNQYNDDYFDGVKSYVKNNSLDKNIFFYHNVTDIKFILSQASIGVLSSISEGLPVSLLEYGLSKLPVVVTNVGECRSVLKNGELGLLVSPSNKKEFALKVEELINNEKFRNHFSKQFYNHVVENYSEGKIIYKLLQIYKS